MSISDRLRSSGYSLFAAIVMISALMACSQAATVSTMQRSGRRADKQNFLVMEAKVVSYKPRAIHDDFVDGTYRTYDLTTLEVKDGSALRVLRVTHAEEPPSGSIWTRVGQTAVVRVNGNFLVDSRALIPSEYVEVVSESAP